MMKGEIRLESKENAGTRAWFTVTFDKALAGASAGDSGMPAAAAAAADNNLSENPPSPPDAFADLSLLPKEELRICIAEDNAINQKIAIQYVRRLGYANVDAYENGARAVDGLRQAAAEGRPYHVILMDVQMPVLDGYEATKVIRRDESEAVRKVLVIAMTASAIHGDREKCIAAGMNDYLAKPVRSDVLKRKLEAYVGHSVHDEPDGDAPPGDNPPPSEAPAHGTNGTTAGPPANNESPATSSTLTPAGTSASVSTSASTSTSTSTPAEPSIESRTSSRGPSPSDQRPSDAGDAGAKRQPRKLVKNRASVDMSGQPPVPAAPAQPQALPLQQAPNAEKPERTKSVLTKKPPNP
jgi:CheY-like chemotaxis protein